MHETPTTVAAFLQYMRDVYTHNTDAPSANYVFESLTASSPIMQDVLIPGMFRYIVGISSLQCWSCGLR